jgi:hypothetical protein
MDQGSMHISFERTGGFAGMRLAADIELDQLPEEDAQKIFEMLKEINFNELPEYPSVSNAADQFSYTITVKVEHIEHTIITGDASAPDDLRPLLDELNQVARRQSRHPQ